MKQRSQEPIRVGVLFSQTGVTSVIENSQRQATLLATEEINQGGGIDGRPVELVIYDPQSRPARYGALAEKLILEDRVRLIVGCYMSSSRKAVIPVVERWNALLMYPTLYEGFEYSRNVFYTGAAPNQNSVQLADFMLRRFGSRVFMVGSDYIYPYESNRIMCDLILERGGEKVAEIYVPLDAQADEFKNIMRRIKDAQPSFIFSTVVGDSTALLHRAYAHAGLKPESMPIASLTTSEAEIQQMGADIAEGHITSAPYFQSLPDATNQACVQNYRQRFGEDQVTNQCWTSRDAQPSLTPGLTPERLHRMTAARELSAAAAQVNATYQPLADHIDGVARMVLSLHFNDISGQRHLVQAQEICGRI